MAVDSKRIRNGLIIFFGVMTAIVMGSYTMTNPRGGIVALVPLVTVVVGLLALVSPRQGIFALAAMVIWVDEIKRLAVVFGGASSFTVIQVLAMPFLVLAALNVGFLASLLYRRTRMDKVGYIIYVVGIGVGCTIFLTAEGGVAARGQRAANIAGYISLIPIAYTYFRSFDDWRRFFAFQALVAFIPAIWAIWQYYNGFNSIELEYARSGLSQTHSLQMAAAEPRAFGLFGSASALGCASIYACFSAWHAWRYRKGRYFLWIPVTIGYFWVLYASEQRTILVYPLIVLVGMIAFRWTITTLAAYATAITLLILGIVYSTWLLDEGLDRINDSIASNSEWGGKVLNVLTFAPRLKGWERLKEPETWSLFGLKDDLKVSDEGSGLRHHDLVNVIIENAGVAGLLAFLIPAVLLLYILHKIPLTQTDKQLRYDTAASLALALPMVAMSFLAGDNFNTNPINLQIWTSFVGVLVVRRNLLTAKAQARRIPAPATAKPTQTRGHKFQHS